MIITIITRNFCITKFWQSRWQTAKFCNKIYIFFVHLLEIAIDFMTKKGLFAIQLEMWKLLDILVIIKSVIISAFLFLENLFGQIVFKQILNKGTYSRSVLDHEPQWNNESLNCLHSLKRLRTIWLPSPPGHKGLMAYCVR